jgi:hypothetical protein
MNRTGAAYGSFLAFSRKLFNQLIPKKNHELVFVLSICIPKITGFHRKEQEIWHFFQSVIIQTEGVWHHVALLSRLWCHFQISSKVFCFLLQEPMLHEKSNDHTKQRSMLVSRIVRLLSAFSTILHKELLKTDVFLEFPTYINSYPTLYFH